MTVAVWFVLGMLAIKLIWNLGVPFELLRRVLANPNSITSGISLSTEIEIILLFVATGLSAASTGQSWVNRPLAVAGWGVVAIVFTYVFMCVVIAIGMWLIKRTHSIE